MKEIVRTAHSKGRVALPGFANATLIIEKVDDTEYRVRKAKVIAEKDLRFHEEEFPLELTAREVEQILETLENPPSPTRAARRAAKRFQAKYGRPTD